MSNLINQTDMQHVGKTHRVGHGLVGAVEGSVTFKTPSTDDAPVYSRLGNTENHRELEALLARAHQAEASIVTGSGMAAFNLILQTMLRPGDHVLVQESCYGGTYNLLTKIFGSWGITSTFAPLKSWNKATQANTKLAIFESITNPFCIPQDLGLAVDICRKNALISVCDNTFASPALCQPLALGVDIVLESATKYLNGHSDVIAGMVAGSKKFMDRLRAPHAYLGTFLHTRECALLTRGMRTLAIRMERHTRTGSAFAEAMESAQDVVHRVHYGATEDHSIGRFFPNGFGGMVAVEFNPKVDVKSMMRSMKFVSDVPSLGGTESTATMPAYTTNWFMTTAEKSAFGINDHLVRFSIGLENAEDVVQDVLAAARRTLPRVAHT